MKQWLDIRTLVVSGMILIPAMLAAGYSGSILLIIGLCWMILLGVLHLLVRGQSTDEIPPPTPVVPPAKKVSAHRGVESILSDRVVLERTTTAILNDFVNCDLEQIEEDMGRVLSRLGSFIGAKRCYLYKFGARNQKCVRWLSWQAPGFDDVLVPPATLSADAATRIYKIFDQEPVVLVNEVTQATHPIAKHLPWSQEGDMVGSCGAARITDDRKNLGFLGFDLDAVSHWGADEKNLLQIVTNQFNTLLSRQDARQCQIEAMEALQASNQAKTEFLANMSHEIRTPLNGVIGIADLLKEMNLTPAQYEYAEIISNSGTMLLNLVSDILDLSKIEAGKVELDPVETDLRVLVEELICVTAFNAQSRGLEMVCRLDPGLPERVLVDPGRLRQVLSNLLNNAVKFTHEGQIFLNIETQGKSGDCFDLRFTVSDTGIGISSEQADRIFEKFTQADGSTTRRFGGTGLGLSICRHLVGLMGGRIRAMGALGEGATFSFTIPLKQLASAEPPAIPETGRRILLVTALELTGDVLAEQIRHLGHQCRVTHAVEEAERLLTMGISEDQDNWDTIILDPTSFVENTYFIFARVNDWPGDKPPQVLLLSQLADKPQSIEQWSQYVTGVLPKPVRVGRLKDMLDGHVESGSKTNDLAGLAQVHPDGSVAENPYLGLKVLLAEDNLFNQKVACGMLKRLGCEVSVVTDGIEALEILEQEGFDLVFMDCQMPRMDGFETSRRIRKLPGEVSKIPIIALTANVFRQDRDACLAAGMDDFLAKPVKKEMLEKALAKGTKVLSPKQEQPS